MSVPLVQGGVPGRSLAVFVQLQDSSDLRDHISLCNTAVSSHLVDPAVDGAVQDAADQKTLHVSGVDVELPRYELDIDASVRLDELYENLIVYSW